MPHSATLASGKPVCRAAAASAVDGGGAAAGGGGEQRWRRRRRRRPWPWLGRPGGECADTCVACRVTTRVRCQLESVTGSRGGQVYLPAVRLLSRAPSRNLILSLFAALFDFAHVLGFLRRASDSQCIHPSFASTPPASTSIRHLATSAPSDFLGSADTIVVGKVVLDRPDDVA